MIKNIKEAVFRRLVFKFSKFDRLGVSANYLKGDGIEIGALNIPLEVKDQVRVKYVDRISAEAHEAIFPDMKAKDMVPVDIIDDAEILSKISDQSQDFVIANHFIEHCTNPIMTLQNLIRVLKDSGMLFLAIPDKRYTFDYKREITTNEHFLKDFREGPEWSDHSHYRDFVMNTEWSKDCKTDEDIENVIRHLRKINFSIHYHVWSHHSMLSFFMMLIDELQFPLEIELAVAPRDNGNESIFVLRKVATGKSQH